MPDAKTMGRWEFALGPSVIKEIHDQVVQIALARRVMQGRKMRIDTTVVESNIHYPTDSGLLGDGVRVLTRSMRKITELAGAVGAKLREPDLHRKAQEKIVAFVTNSGHVVTGIVPSAIKGADGNQEFFACIRKQSV